MTEELLKRLDLLAAKVGSTTERLWDALVRQASLDATWKAIAILLTMAIAALLARHAAKFGYPESSVE